MQAPPPAAPPVATSLNEPKRVKTITIPRPDDGETTAGFPSAPPASAAPAPRAAAGSKQQNSQSGSAPIQITPDPKGGTKTASRTPAPAAGASGAYAVQVSARRPRRAQSSYRALQSKYPSVLGGREASIKRVELGGGTWYRAQVGGFASSTRRTSSATT